MSQEAGRKGSPESKFMISLDTNFGRCLIARNRIRAGEVIIDELAIVQGPSPTPDSAFICPTCYSRIHTSTVCPHCSLPLCQIDCHKDPIHLENECRVFKAVPELLHIFNQHSSDLYQFITVLRCLRLKSQRSTKWTQILQLQSTPPSPSAPLQEAFSRLNWDLIGATDENDKELMELTHKCLGALQTNSFSELRASKSVENLYFFSSFMAHSCVMNTERQFDPYSSRIVVLATKLIEAGEPITNTYLPYLLNTEERFKRLSKPPWDFVCRCVRCQDPTELGSFLGNVQCPSCKLLSLSPRVTQSEALKWVCSACGEVPSDTSLVQQKLFHIEEELKNMDGSLICDWLERVSGEGWLHPNHSILINLKFYLCQSLGNEDQAGIQGLSNAQLRNKLNYGKDVLSAVKKLIQGQLYIFVGKILSHMWWAIRELQRRKILVEKEADLVNCRWVAHQILKHALPGTNEWKMKEVLDSE